MVRRGFDISFPPLMERRVYHSIELLAVFRSVTDPLSLNRGTRSDSLDKTEAEYYQVRIFGGHRYGFSTRARVLVVSYPEGLIALPLKSSRAALKKWLARLSAKLRSEERDAKNEGQHERERDSLEHAGMNSTTAKVGAVGTQYDPGRGIVPGSINR
jgi:hypothetical protein